MERHQEISEPLLPQSLGPYRLEKLLGSGGMGSVYLAYDRRLDRRVALKQVHSTGDDSHRLRFLREARAAARLGHPNIVQVFDVLETEEGDWIVLELVDGPTVAERIREGDLDLATALDLGRQIAEGLAEAHEQGTLHRDLKSENVLVAPGNRAKILDFGLAKSLWAGDGDATVTVEGRVLGTCRAMSPEQARGLPLDARSDLFSLGVLLYEMVTGTSPFQGPTAMDSLSRVCNLVQPPAISLRPQVPEALSRLIDRLLAKRPELRPASARDVAAELAAVAAGLSPARGAAAVPAVSPLEEDTVLELPSSVGSGSGGRPTLPWTAPPTARHPRRRLSRPVWAAAALTALLVVGAAAWWGADPHRGAKETAGTASATPSFPVRRSVAVLGFQNLSGDPDVAWLSTGFAEMLTAELAAGQRLRTIAGENVARAKRELSLADGATLAPDTLGRVRSILGADLVVQGSFLAATDPGRRLRLVLSVQDTNAGDTVLTLSETGNQAGVLDLISNVGSRLRQGLGVGPVSAAATGQARASVPTGSQALRLYSEGLERLRAYDYVSARDLLTEAVAAEPEHPLAHAALAEAWSALGYDEKARQEAHRAVEVAGDLSREDRLFVEARDHEMSRRWEEAIRSYRSLWDFFPDNLDYGLRLAGALVSAGRGREALEVVETLRRAPSPASKDVRIDLAEAAAAESLSDHKRVLAAAGVAVREGETQGARLLVAQARVLEAKAHLRLGDPKAAAAAAQAARELSAAAGDRGGEAVALNLVGLVEAETGDLLEARAIRRQVLSVLEAVGNRREIAKTLNNLADTEMNLGDLEAARGLLGRALEAAREIHDARLEGGFQINLAELERQRGNLAQAQRLAEQALEVSRGYQWTYAINGALLILGEIELSQGRLTQARSRFEEGLESTRNAGDPHFSARFLESLGKLELAEGHLEEARTLHGQALAWRQQTGDRRLAGESRLSLAVVAVEEARPAEAVELLESSLAEEAAHGNPAKEIRLAGALARARLDLGEPAPVREAAESLATLVPRCRNVEARLWASIQLARCRAATGAVEAEEAAETALEEVRGEAERLGFLPLEIEAHLALAELHAAGAAGAAEARRAAAIEELEEVRQAASARGLGRLAARAAALTAALSSP